MENYVIDWLSKVIELLPDVNGFTIPNEIYLGFQKLTALLGYYMPFDLYVPLITFIISFTAFRIVYAIYMRIKK